MATNVITPSNSRSTQLADLDDDAVLLVTEGAYIVETRNGYPAYYADAGGAQVTIDGTLMASGNVGALYLGQNESTTAGGGNTVDIGTTGQLEGKSGISMFGGKNSVTNEGMIRGSSVGTPYLGEVGTTNISAGIYSLGADDNITNGGTIVGYYGIFTSGGGLIQNNSVITGFQDSIFSEYAETITNNGTINGGIEAFQGAITLTNYGLVNGSLSAYSGATAACHVYNYGNITGEVGLGAGDDIVDNSGQMGGYILTWGGRDYVLNEASGTMGDVDFSQGGDSTDGDTLENYGTLDRAVFGASSDVFDNYGVVNYSIDLGDGDNAFENHGTMYASLTSGAGSDSGENYGVMQMVSLGTGADVFINAAGGVVQQSVDLGANDTSADTFINHGTVGFDGTAFGLSSVYFGDGGDTFTNTGTVYGKVDMGAGNYADSLTNSGRIAGGVATGGGDDTIDNSLGEIDGLVALGTGNDSYTGGAGRDKVKGDLGADTISLGAGDDSYIAVNNDGNDIVDGGPGVDTYDGSAVTSAFTVDLSAGVTSGAVGVDAISNFENIIGGSGADTLTGDDAANTIDGGAGNDTIYGGAGNDRLIGRGGSDTIVGGPGRDIMSGDLAAGGTLASDTFVFADGDSGNTYSTRDIITDFTDHGSASAPFATAADIIDLRQIDANTALAGDQAFTFNSTAGAAFSGAAGSLIWAQYSGYALVSGDTNGDGKADFVIQLNGTHKLFASDFLL